MARIAGVDLPKNERIEIGLTRIFGVGRSVSKKILEQVNVNPDTRVKDLKDEDSVKIRALLEKDFVTSSHFTGRQYRNVLADNIQRMRVVLRRNEERSCSHW